MNIRGAVPADAEPMRSLAAQSGTAAQWNADVYARIFAEPGRLAWVAEHDGLVTGFIVARMVSGEWEIENLVVAPSHRRQGMGKALVLAVIGQARENSVSNLMLEVRESNQAARSLYRKVGFLETGRRTHYYSAPEEDAILLTLRLH